MWRSFPARNFLSRAYSASLVAQAVKNLLAMQETWVWSWCWKDPLEKEITTHSSVLARTEEPGRLQSMGLQRVRHDWATNTSLSYQENLHLRVSLLLWRYYRQRKDFHNTHLLSEITQNGNLFTYRSWLKVTLIVLVIGKVSSINHCHIL